MRTAAARAGLRLLADDLTGALDSAVAFGAGVPVYLDRPGPVADGADVDAPAVQVVATATRDVPVDELPARLGACVPWLAEAGLAFKKVDSLLRGNTLAEVRCLAAAGGFKRVVFAPAFPAQGRYTLGGRLAVAPPGGTVDHAEVRGEDLRTALQAEAWPAGCALALPDVRAPKDLDTLVTTWLDDGVPTLWCGSAGLAQAMAQQSRWRSSDFATPFATPFVAPFALPRGREVAPVWVIGASHQSVTRRQWARVMAAYPEALAVRHGDPVAFEQVLSQLRRAAAGEVKPPALVLLDLSPLTPLTAAQAAALLREQVQQLAVLPTGPARLLVLGGDTARALVQASGVQHLVSGQPVRPGWGQAYWQGGRWAGLRMDCRSGAFGGDDDVLDAVLPPNLSDSI